MKWPGWLGVALGACIVAVGVSICLGPAGVRWPFGGDLPITQLRVPRVLMAALVGASLAVAGAALQALLRNDLAEPYVLGLSGGAAAGAVTSLACLPGLSPGPAAACGALGAAGLVRVLARGAYEPARLLLAGIAVGSLLASLSGLVLVLAPQSQLLRSSSYWLFGGIGTPRAAALIVPGCVLTVALLFLRARAERLDRLSLGVDIAASLGTDVRGLQRGVLFACVGLTAASVAASGLIGFVGLIAPHAARRMVGPAHRALLPLSAALGALLVVLADTVARIAFAPREVPVGLLTAALGGPLFLLQLQRDGRGGAGSRSIAPRARAATSAASDVRASRANVGRGIAGPDISARLARGEAGSALAGASRGSEHDGHGHALSQERAPDPPSASKPALVGLGLASRHRAARGSVLECSSLSVGRAGQPVVRAVELAIQPGERIALLGENGAGKTTLLRAFAGLDAPLAGSLRWSGRELPRGRERARLVGVLLQGERAASFSVRELVTLGLGLDGPPSAADAGLVEVALERAHLQALAERPCSALSGGEAQRAALARALVAEPGLLLLDEPTQHLDPARQAQLVRELDALRGAVAVILSTHDLALAASSDRVLLVHAGAVLALGPPSVVLTPELLAQCLGVVVERRDDGAGGAPVLRVLAPCPTEVAA